MTANPEWLVLCVWRALLGEIYPSIRGVAISLSEKNILVIRYYMDREPIEFDSGSMEVVATNISAQIGLDKISRIELECEYAFDPISELDPLDGFVYCRREYDM
ncbi:colicin [Pseudomonas sp. C2B4]|uniref:colicin n=1 Tax=Pseudomonas sp. C2B4 TaxID=2735270 RepID=UPI001586659A|nr:colicin [Pseudomonas sp. C2B4]NUU39027.1 colicin [Pseudomonas sp. C2B4]